MGAFLQDVIDAGGVHSVRRSNVMLVLATPTPKPHINSIVISQLIRHQYRSCLDREPTCESTRQLILFACTKCPPATSVVDGHGIGAGVEEPRLFHEQRESPR